MPPKQKYSPEDVIDAAFQIVRRHGWEGLSARAIAKELNSSTRPVYDYFQSMKHIEQEVVKKTMDVVLEYTTASRSGDPWIDQAVGVVMFALEEKYLFRAIFDEKHVDTRKKYSVHVWKTGEEELSDYPLFKCLSKSQVEAIRRARWVFTHGLASLMNISNWPWKKENEPLLIKMVQRMSRAIYNEFKDDPDILLSQEHFQNLPEPKK
jgi:AcrR family transcriptional regulator